MARTDIFKFVTSKCVAAHLPGAWARFGPSNDFLQPGAEWPELFDQLRSRFSENHLLASGVVAQDNAGRITITPCLADSGILILPIWRSSQYAPFDLLVDGKSLAGRPVALLSMNHGRMPPARPDLPDPLFVCASFFDVAVLGAMGFAAAPATGLETLGGRALDNFCKATRRARHQTSPPLLIEPSVTHGAPVPLVLVNSSLAELTSGPIADIDRVREHLLSIDRHLDIDLEDCDVWQPVASDYVRLRYCLQHGDAEDVKLALEQSIAKQSVGLDATSAAPTDSTYASAQQHWFDVKTQSDGRTQKAAWSELLNAHQQAVLDAILQKAADTKAPTERMLWSTLADVSRMRHMQAAAMMIPYIQLMAGQSTRADFSLSPIAFSQQMQLVAKTLSLSQELNRLRGLR
jgi:hypothetical protein